MATDGAGAHNGALAVEAHVRESDASLPAALTRFVGRRHERSETKRLLSVSRLVTLTGFGGVGKTRLALRVASDTRRAFRDGVRFVDLSELREPSLLTGAVATQLGLRWHSDQTLHRALMDFLAGRDLLIVLDNCEHLVEECALLVATLLRACPRLHILATSRQPLRIGGETVYPVNPLPVPPETRPTEAGVYEYEAVRLFVDRAQSVLPDFAMDESNREAVVGICRYLEGIPLALELAAVRLRALSAAEILDRLTHHWQLLTVGDRSAPQRQQTLQSCIEWSYTLCSPGEQDLWARASVFAGGFELDAVDCLYRSDENYVSPEEQLELVMGLADKSVLIREEHAGRVRYRMLETIRTHGLAQLAGGGRLDQMRRRLRQWCTDATDRARAEWMSPRQVEWMTWLRREYANVGATLQFCADEADENDAGLRIATNIHYHMIGQVLLQPARLWFDRLLARPGGPSLLRAAALRSAGLLALLQDDRASAQALIREGREWAAVLGEPATGYLDQVSGVHAMFQGDLARASAELERARDVFSRCGETTLHLETTVCLGAIHLFAGEAELALQRANECLSISQAAGVTWFRTLSTWTAGVALLASGDTEQAAEVLTEGLRLGVATDERLGVASYLDALAWTVTENDPSRSAVLLGAADTAWRTTGTSPSMMHELAVRRSSCEQRLRSLLGDAGLASGMEQGARLDQESALRFVLGSPQRASGEPTVEVRGAPTPLTKREQQVAELVSRGLTNKEIASELVISVRTADTHVERILTKLGFTSRNRIAAWITEQHHEKRQPTNR